MKGLLFILLAALPILNSCGRFELDFEDEVIARNFYVWMDENPEENFEIGTIDASSSFIRIYFQIDSMYPEGAFTVHETEGTVHVANPELFDYEKDTLISGRVTAYNKDNAKTINVQINLQDIEE